MYTIDNIIIFLQVVWDYVIRVLNKNINYFIIIEKLLVYEPVIIYFITKFPILLSIY